MKPELFRHDGLYELERASGLPIRIAWVGLFTACDREGRFRWKPQALKLDVMPWDDLDFARVLDVLRSAGLVVKYEVKGESYGYIPSWLDHQRPNHRELPSKLPAHDAVMTPSSRGDDPVTTRARGEGKGREGKGAVTTASPASLREEIGECIEEWKRTLRHFDNPRDPRLDEIPIGKLIQRRGGSRTRAALAGFRGDKGSDKWDPGAWLVIGRLQDDDNFDRFENFGLKIFAEEVKAGDAERSRAEAKARNEAIFEAARAKARRGA